jgi:hypothetical protein
MNIKAKCLTALFFLSATSLAAAGPVVDAATQAEALNASGKTVEALEALDRAVDVIWQESPLAFRKVALVNSSGGYGIYEERADNTFRPDEKMMIYVEPVGFAYGGSGASSSVDFKADLAIQNATGQVLGESKDIFSLSTPSQPNKREFSMTLTFGAPFLRPGDYNAVFTVRDGNSDKSGTFEVPFTIELPTAN